MPGVESDTRNRRMFVMEKTGYEDTYFSSSTQLKSRPQGPFVPKYTNTSKTFMKPED